MTTRGAGMDGRRQAADRSMGRTAGRAIGLSAGLALVAAGVLAGCVSSGSNAGSGGRGASSGVQAPEQLSTLERTRRAMELAERARHTERRGRTEEAARLYAESLTYDPGLFVSLNNLGVLLIEQRNYLDAVQFLTRAAEVEPTDPRPVTNIALCWQSSGHDRDALRYFEQALARDRNWQDALRGASLSGQRLGLVSRDGLRRVERALQMEADPQWREFLMREKFRIERELATRAITED